MRTFSFSDDVLRRLAQERFQHPDPCVQQRMEIVWLKSHGERHERIAELADASRSTVQRVLTRYAEGGLDALRTIDRKSPTGALAEHRFVPGSRISRAPAAHCERSVPTDRGTDRRPPELHASPVISARYAWLALAQSRSSAGAAEVFGRGTRPETGGFFKIRSWSRVWRRRGRVNGRCISWTRPTSWWGRSWVGCGVRCGCSCGGHRGGSATTCSGRSTP